MNHPDIRQSTTRRHLSGLTTKGRIVAAMVTLRDRWDTLTPAQQQEASDLVERLATVYRREHSVVTRQPVRVPLVGRIVA